MRDLLLLLTTTLSFACKNGLSIKDSSEPVGGDSDATTDADGDGYTAGEDCDDADAGINPGAEEVCDGVDNDCDGETDGAGASDAPTWHADVDDDSYGDGDTAVSSCEPPSGYVADSGDCDDDDATIHPAAEEVCDGLDNDCDGDIDGDGASDAATWYADADGDSYGDSDTAVVSCDQPGGYVADGNDCDDTDAAVYPGAPDSCNDCDSPSSGSLSFTVVQSSYVYLGSETLAELLEIIASETLVCSTELTSADSFGGPTSCGSGTSDLGFHLSMTFQVPEEDAGLWMFRLGPDFGNGGALFVDEVDLAHAVDDLWWDLDWANESELLTSEVMLEAGVHTFATVGFESCCAGDMALQVSIDGADWVDVSESTVELECVSD